MNIRPRAACLSLAWEAFIPLSWHPLLLLQTASPCHLKPGLSSPTHYLIHRSSVIFLILKSSAHIFLNAGWTYLTLKSKNNPVLQGNRYTCIYNGKSLTPAKQEQLQVLPTIRTRDTVFLESNINQPKAFLLRHTHSMIFSKFTQKINLLGLPVIPNNICGSWHLSFQHSGCNKLIIFQRWESEGKTE